MEANILMKNGTQFVFQDLKSVTKKDDTVSFVNKNGKGNSASVIYDIHSFFLNGQAMKIKFSNGKECAEIRVNGGSPEFLSIRGKTYIFLPLLGIVSGDTDFEAVETDSVNFLGGADTDEKDCF